MIPHYEIYFSKLALFLLNLVLLSVHAVEVVLHFCLENIVNVRFDLQHHVSLEFDLLF